MQVEHGLAFVLLEHFVINIKLLPMLEHVRLALGKAGAHGEIGLGKIQGQIVFLCHFLLLRMLFFFSFYLVLEAPTGFLSPVD